MPTAASVRGATVLFLACLNAGAMAQSTSTSSGQAYPTKPIRWISPFAAGGGTDLTTRLVAQRIAEVIGQAIVIDNRIGASGNIGTEIAARAPADGYTLVTITASHPLSQALSERLPFELLRDFVHVTQMTTQPYILLVHPSINAHSVKELVALARAAPRTLHYGTAGVGTLQHVGGMMLAQMTGTELMHVPYKGGAPALVDLLGGRLQFFFGVPVSTIPLIKAGKLRSIAVTSLKRSTVLPELPTIAETGLTGYSVDNWYGIGAPAKTPREVVARLNSAAARALQVPELRERLRQDGADSVGNSTGEFTAIVRGDLERWRKQARDAGIKAE